MNKRDRDLIIEKEIEVFEKKYGDDVAYRWNGRWIKKKDLNH